MTIQKIIFSFCVYKEETCINNSQYTHKYNELKQLTKYCCDIWNNIVYAWKRTHTQIPNQDIDIRFYYQTIIFNLYILGITTKSIERDILMEEQNLKDLRDNIAHMAERLKRPLNFININKINPNGFGGNIIGNTIDTDSNGQIIIASPLGIIENTIYSSLKPNPEKSNYKNKEFVAYQVTEDKLENIQGRLISFLNKYFEKIELEKV